MWSMRAFFLLFLQGDLFEFDVANIGCVRLSVRLFLCTLCKNFLRFMRCRCMKGLSGTHRSGTLLHKNIIFLAETNKMDTLAWVVFICG